MSNHDLLSTSDATVAASQGWTVCYVHDLKSRSMSRQIHPLEFKPPFTSVDKTSRWVIQRAQQGDELAIRALRIVMQGHKRK